MYRCLLFYSYCIIIVVIITSCIAEGAEIVITPSGIEEPREQNNDGARTVAKRKHTVIKHTGNGNGNGNNDVNSNNRKKNSNNNNSNNNNRNTLGTTSSCVDLRTHCADRVDTCHSNWKYMHAHCPKTCHVCHNRTRTVSVNVETLTDDRRLLYNNPWMEVKSQQQQEQQQTKRDAIVDVAGDDLGVAQILDPTMENRGSYQQEIMDVIIEAREYIENVVMVLKRYEKVRHVCKNKVPQCSVFAAQGECEENPDWMEENCAPVCHSCETLHIEARCPLDPNIKHVWYPGDQYRMFERIIADPEIVQRYQPKVWARPTLAEGDSADNVDYMIDSPWVVTLENFLNAEEAQILIDHGGKVGYERSADVGKMLEDGSFEDDINEGRTSENAWCEEDCKDDPITIGIMERIEFVTGIHANYSESLQLLRYEPGQFYGVHHDFVAHEVDRLEGPRILTVFLYLNDVEEGGETRFDDLDLKVAPKLGRALLWPSVRNENPLAFEPKTHHEALPVIRGVKYGANAWLHLRDVAGPTEYGC